MAKTIEWVRAAGMLVWPDLNRPPEPAGMVRRRPGLSAMKREVVTRRSVLVRTRPIALATRLYTRKNTKAWKNTAILSVLRFMKETLEPEVVRSTPGLSARKRAAGMATF
jgi:hypothetical protein